MAGAWKVTDLVVNGESILGAFSERDWTDEAGGIRVRLLAARVDSPHARLYLEVENTTPEPIELRYPGGAIPRRGLGWRWRHAVLGTHRIEPGVTRIEAGFSSKKLRRGMDVRPPVRGRRRARRPPARVH